MRAMNDMIENMMPKNERESKLTLALLVACIVVFALAVRFCA